MTKPNGGWRGQTGTRHERGYGAAWDKLRPLILARDHHLCQVCLAQGKLTPANIVDHIKPKAEGGTDEPENLRTICGPHHKAKTTREGHEARGHKAPRVIGLDGYPIEQGGGGSKSMGRGSGTGAGRRSHTSAIQKKGFELWHGPERRWPRQP